MLSLFFLIPVALLLTLIGMLIFLWAVRSGQFEDLDRAGRELLLDNQPAVDNQKNNNENKEE